MNLIAYSQGIILNKDGDTTITISNNQAKFLILKYYQFEEKNNLLNICDKNIIYKDSIISVLKINNLKQDSIIKSDSEMIDFIKKENSKNIKRVQFWYKKYNAQLYYKKILLTTSVLFAFISVYQKI